MSSHFRSIRLCGSLVLVAAPLLAAAPVHAQAVPTRLTEAESVSLALGDGDFARGAQARRDAARAGADAITRFENPSLSVSRNTLSGPVEDEEEWEIGFVQPLDLTGRRSALREAAVAEAEATDADVQRRTHERRAQARRAYVDCAVAVERAAATAGYRDRLTGAERIVAERSAAGDTAVYDLRRVRVEARAAEAEARLAEGEIAAECATLARLTGTPGALAAEPLRPPALIPNMEPVRADLVARERRVEAAGYATRAAERSRWPEVQLGVGWRRVEALGFEADGPQVSVGVTIPLFDRGSARVREARALEHAEAADLALARREALAEVEAAEARAIAAVEAVRVAETARDDAGRLGVTAETAYQAGEIGVTELVDAYRAAHEAELSIIEMTGHANLAAIELELAQGGPNP